MCKVLMPIKPEYAMQILNGTKNFEYRKIKFKRKNVDSIVIYVTSPVMEILGEVELKGILEDSPEQIWKQTHNNGGISKLAYDSYFEGKNKAIAYMLGKVKKYEKALKLKDFHINYYPQSYVYLD